MDGKGRRWGRGSCLSGGIRGPLTGHVGRDPQLLPAKPCLEVPGGGGVWNVGGIEQRGSVQTRETRPVRCWSNLKDALPPREPAGSANLHAKCIVLHIEIRWAY